MKMQPRVAIASLLIPVAANLAGCQTSAVSCDAVGCAAAVAVTLAIPSTLAPGTTVTACRGVACITAQLPMNASAGALFQISASPPITATVSGGPEPWLRVDWWTISAPVDGETYSVSVQNPDGTATASIAQTATYVSRTSGGPCPSTCTTASLTTVSSMGPDAAPPAAHDAGPPPAADAGDAPVPDAGPPAISCRPQSPCPSGWLLDQDRVCWLANTGETCAATGDNLCYLPCHTDADCAANGLSSCGSITFFGGTDVGKPVSVCNGSAGLAPCPDARLR